MVDETGRKELTALLRALPARHGTSVVHVTHRPEEAALADRGYRLAAGEVVAEGSGPVIAAAATGEAQPIPPSSHLGIAAVGAAAPATLRLAAVTHTYGIGTPWAQTALQDVDLSIEAREGVLIVGGNGSGKSTLAWILAGLLRPSYGECLLGGTPVREQIGSVALAFQHARLQLQRSTVGRDVRAAGAADDEAVAAALAAVGLAPAAFADRRIDSLSGGEQRRVALAGLLSRRPSALVLDEPLAGLDARSRDGLLDLLAGLRHDHGLTIVVISHDLGGMDRVCDRLVRLDGGRILGDTMMTAAGR